MPPPTYANATLTIAPKGSKNGGTYTINGMATMAWDANLDGFYWETRGVRDARLNWKDWDLKSQSIMHRVHGWTVFERRVDHNTWNVHILRMVIS